jgi:hypothetical protein
MKELSDDLFHPRKAQKTCIELSHALMWPKNERELELLSQDRKSSEQFMGFHRGYHEMKA